MMILLSFELTLQTQLYRRQDFARHECRTRLVWSGEDSVQHGIIEKKTRQSIFAGGAGA